MKKLLLFGSLLLAGLALADKAVTFSSARITITAGRMQPLVDGGCAVEACANVQQADGGEGYARCTGVVEATDAGQARCLNVLSDMLNLWKTKESL